MADQHRSVYSSMAPTLNLRCRVGTTSVSKMNSEPHAPPDILATAPNGGAHLRSPGGDGKAQNCIVCAKNMGRYTCPRCFAHYCTAECYRKHGERCTESFYQEHVVDELHSRPVTSDAERREMIAILKRMQNEAHNNCSEPNGEDGEAAVNAEFIGTALEHMQLDESTEWEHLTPEQQTAFIKAVENGKLADIVEPWQPWWTVAGAVLESKDSESNGMGGQETSHAKSAASDEEFLSQILSAGEQKGEPAVGDSASSRHGELAPAGVGPRAQASKPPGVHGSGAKKVVIQDVDEDSDDSQAERTRGEVTGGERADCRAEADEVDGGSVCRVPQVPKQLPPLASLTSKDPSPLLPYSLAGLLWCYALSQRRCNGETHGDVEMAGEAARVLLIAGGPLLLPQAEVPPPPPSSVSDAILQCTEASAKEDGRLPLPLLLELAEDVETLLGAKSRVLAALSDARDGLRTAASAARTKAAASNLRKAERKVWFFLCWANEVGHQALQAARRQVRLFRSAIELQLSDAATNGQPAAASGRGGGAGGETHAQGPAESSSRALAREVGGAEKRRQLPLIQELT